ncbi:MAG: low specificity L-threonine aldolase [Bacteroidetes bacterium SW_7_64_58]|nr:MAG: low specificity L-threonine aldolase [Bacteroidetes bacterium SW_7_64_58]
MPMIDLRSDTVTRPSQGMRQAMYEAEVGDDVYGEDPTVNRLQERVAAVLGKEAALFVPSGTMANQICLHVLTDPGDEVLLERGSHVFNYESGAAGLLSGIQLHPLDGDRGRLSPSQVDAAVRPAADVLPRTRVVSVENTANKAGGVVYSPDRIQSIAEVARAHDLHLHLDGARLWNAAAALEVEEQALAAPADLVWVALSKGLGAPVGSVIAGPSLLIDTARRTRKQFGGGMRQAGILAAAGLYAIEHHRPALDRDHEKAHRLAEGIAACPQFSVDPAEVDTNIVIFEGPADRAADIVEDLQEDGVLLTPFGPSTIRVTERPTSPQTPPPRPDTRSEPGSGRRDGGAATRSGR